MLEKEDTNERWCKYREELHKKFPKLIIYTKVWSLNCSQTIWEVKLNGPNNKAVGVDEILARLFKSLQDDAVKVLLVICKLINTAVAKGWEKINLYSDTKKGNAKEFPNYWTIVLTIPDCKIMFKILQTRLYQ